MSDEIRKASVPEFEGTIVTYFENGQPVIVLVKPDGTEEVIE